MELARTDVSEVMVPEAAIVSLPATVTAQAAAETLRRTGRSRIPIFGANRDDILGILIGKDLWDQMVETQDPDSVVPARLIRPAFCVPETCNAFQLIEDLRGNRTQMAIVLNEYGAVAGLVTLEDLLEQLVGPIDDEHDVPTPADPITALGGTRFEVDAALPLEVLNSRFDLHLPTEEEFQTVGGLAMHALGRLPEKGATFRHDGIEFTILDVRDHSIRRVMLDFQPAGSALNEHSSTFVRTSSLDQRSAHESGMLSRVEAESAGCFWEFCARAKATSAPATAPQRWPSHEMFEPNRGITPKMSEPP